MALHDAQADKKELPEQRSSVRRGDAVNVRIMPPQNTLERQNVIATIINSKRNLFQWQSRSQVGSPQAHFHEVF